MKRFHAALVALTLTGSIALAAGIASASAAETGTKTMPDSSVYPPRTHAGHYNYRYARPYYRYARPYYARPYYRYAGLYNYRYARPYYRYARPYYARPYYRYAGSIITDTRDPITDTDDLTTRDLTDTHQDSIITDTRDPITRALSGGTTITPPAIISLMTPTTGPPLKTWRRIVAGIQIIPTAGQFGTELRRTSRVADAMCHLAASALCACRVRPQCYGSNSRGTAFHE